MNKPIVLGIDVDQTVLESDKLWWKWMYSMCEPLEKNTIHTHNQDLDKSFMFGYSTLTGRTGELEYDLSKYFGKPKNKNVDVYDFWRNEGAFDLVYPIHNAAKTIDKLISDGFEIVFVTHVKGNTYRSKYNCLKRHINGKFDYIGTQEKFRVKCDFLIDDRINHLNRAHDCGIIPIQYQNRPYTQSEKRKAHYPMYTSWADIYRYMDAVRSIGEKRLLHIKLTPDEIKPFSEFVLYKNDSRREQNALDRVRDKKVQDINSRAIRTGNVFLDMYGVALLETQFEVVPSEMREKTFFMRIRKKIENYRRWAEK